MPTVDLDLEEIEDILADQVGFLESNHIGLALDHDVSACPADHFDDPEQRVECSQALIRKLSPFVEGF